MGRRPRRRFSRFCALRGSGEGLGCLDRGDRATAKDPIVRYERDRPGEPAHVDVKKLAAIPDGAGHRTRGRGYPGRHARRRVCCRFIHSALDDRSRLVCSEVLNDEVLNDERAVTAAGFWARAAAWFASCGVARVERVLTDNGSCYRSSQ